eukprot:scaffold1809_cov386-Prasinococcus_capsulatus_cf.AAC.62
MLTTSAALARKSRSGKSRPPSDAVRSQNEVTLGVRQGGDTKVERPMLWSSQVQAWLSSGSHTTCRPTNRAVASQYSRSKWEGFVQGCTRDNNCSDC